MILVNKTIALGNRMRKTNTWPISPTKQNKCLTKNKTHVWHKTRHRNFFLHVLTTYTILILTLISAIKKHSKKVSCSLHIQRREVLLYKFCGSGSIKWFAMEVFLAMQVKNFCVEIFNLVRQKSRIHFETQDIFI